MRIDAIEERISIPEGYKNPAFLPYAASLSGDFEEE
jgi:hypothetical protein